MSIHDGHRSHMREKFLKTGLDGMQEHEVLELLLFYCIPRKDTNATAHNLINRFGTVAKVLDAPIRELKKVEGIGDNAALFLQIVKALSRHYYISSNLSNQALTTYEACGEYLIPYYVGVKSEVVMLLCLDAKCMVLDCIKVSEGNVNSAEVPIRKIVDLALSTNATSVVLAHNHPSGVALPSREDVLTTIRVAKALQFVNVALSDHILIADDDYVSLTLSNLYNYDDIVNESSKVMP